MIPIRQYRHPQASSAYTRGEPYIVAPASYGQPPALAPVARINIIPSAAVNSALAIQHPPPRRPEQTQPAKKRRASKPKVKTGCITCKIRRVKCDEGKPACLRCTSTGRKCDGYEAPRSPPPDQPDSGRNGQVQLPSSMSVSFEGTIQERRIFHRFQTFTIPAFAGGSEADFWNIIVLKVGVQEPVIRNAIVALGTIHEDYQNRAGSHNPNLIEEPGHQRALQLYVKAVRQLNEKLSGPERGNAQLAIIASILFACFEVLRRHDMTAIIHYRAGMRELMRQMNLRRNEPIEVSSETIPHRDQTVVRQIPQNELDVLLRVFARYDVQACTFAKPYAEPLSTELPAVPPTSITLKEARNHLDNLLIAAYQLIKSDNAMYRYWSAADVPVDWQLNVADALVSFQNWQGALEEFFAASEAEFSPAETKSLLGLRLQIKVAIIMLKTSINCGLETTFDQFRDEFDEMVTSVERVTQSLAMRDADPLDRENTPFTMELGIIHPLFFVATKCRESRLRRRAIAQLRKAGKEGVWEGPIMAVVAKRMMQIEERGLISGQKVPERSRIHKMQKLVDYDGRKVMAEMTLAQDETWKRWETIREMIPF